MSFCKDKLVFILMTRPEKIKTQLGQRLTKLRKHLGYEDRKELASVLGVHKDTLGNYERGDREPDLKFLVKYISRFKVNLNWIADGKGEMFTDPMETPASIKTINIHVARKVCCSFVNLFNELKHPVNAKEITETVVKIYNDMLSAGVNFENETMLMAAITERVERLRENIAKDKVRSISRRSK